MRTGERDQARPVARTRLGGRGRDPRRRRVGQVVTMTGRTRTVLHALLLLGSIALAVAMFVMTGWPSFR